MNETTTSQAPDATGTGFDGGPVFHPAAEPVAPVPTGDAPDDGLFAGLLGEGEKVTPARASEWLQTMTAGLDEQFGGPDGLVKANLQMTDREARMIGAGIAEWSERTQLVSMVVDPPKVWVAGAGMLLYGWRVRGEHRFSLELEADAAQGAHQLQPLDDPIGVDHPEDVA